MLDDPPRLNDRQRAFAQHIAHSFNATKAAIHAGYSPRTAASQGHDLLKKPEIQRFIRALRDERNADLEVSSPDVIARWAQIAVADPGEVVQILNSACRYCHGDGHLYQWRSQREFNEHHHAWDVLRNDAKKRCLEPVPLGGFGYRRTEAPHPDCPECDGLGETQVRLTPTKDLSVEGRALLESVHQTKDGIKIKLASRTDALKELSKIRGVYDQADAGETVSALGQWINDLQKRGSKPPLASD